MFFFVDETSFKVEMRNNYGLNNETILIMDNVSFHKSAIVTELA